MTQISKTTVTFTVLHRTDDPVLSGQETIGEYDHAYDGLLGYIMRESWDGGMVGVESDPKTVPVPDDQVPGELLAMGNDGTFFDDDLEEG
jgi:hypothetical protein